MFVSSCKVLSMSVRFCGKFGCGVWIGLIFFIVIEGYVMLILLICSVIDDFSDLYVVFCEEVVCCMLEL